MCGAKCITRYARRSTNFSYLYPMLLYNVTIIIEDDSAAEWLKWMHETHIPAVMETGKFVSNRLLKVLDSPNEGTTYCIQYVAENMETYEEYQRNDAPALQAELQAKFANRHVAFRTLMEFVG
jgi:hypothetical protein